VGHLGGGSARGRSGRRGRASLERAILLYEQRGNVAAAASTRARREARPLTAS
jgi:hypothetical protein